MSARKEYLRRRRERLVMLAAAQRSELSSIAAHLQTKLQWVDGGFAIGQALRAHPVLALAAGSLLLRVTRSNRLRRIGQLFTAWELFNMVRNQYRTWKRS
ncbi:YqjK family protein [Sedimenticola sp.]|uniref:YqjK family protein n=1 Tax=Sedimenticola sp. TaxID=1940285 RepID=UPI002587E32C|nr:YqjK family protein [Sedimenticola sp.]MCW8903822.1 YqjK family protein [Sedimenticola sp.]